MLFQELPESLDLSRPPPNAQPKNEELNGTKCRHVHAANSLHAKDLEDANKRRRMALSSRLYPNAFIRPDRLNLFELVAPDGRVILRVERQ